MGQIATGCTGRISDPYLAFQHIYMFNIEKHGRLLKDNSTGPSNPFEHISFGTDNLASVKANITRQLVSISRPCWVIRQFTCDFLKLIGHDVFPNATCQ